MLRFVLKAAVLSIFWTHAVGDFIATAPEFVGVLVTSPEPIEPADDLWITSPEPMDPFVFNPEPIEPEDVVSPDPIDPGDDL